jgi:hypothetical protein
LQAAVVVQRQSPKKQVNGNSNNSNNNSTPRGPRVAVIRKPIKTKLESALETANSVSRNKNHPNHTEVKQLLDSYKKKWVEDQKFVESLAQLLFK